jgi:microcompartment protein CcmL/EutN
MGLVEVEGVAGIITAADAGCKAANVQLEGWESIGGFTTVFFSGSTSAIEAALQAGEAAALQVTDHVVSSPVTRPDAACWSFVSFPRRPDAPATPGALGLLETRGYGAHVALNDLMFKTAAVEIRRVLTVHNRVVCTLIQGDVASVRAALDAGLTQCRASDNFMGSALLPQPLPEVLQAFANED